MEIIFYIDTKQAYFPPASVKVEWKSQMMDGRLKNFIAWCEQLMQLLAFN